MQSAGEAGKLWSLMDGPGTCWEIRLGAGNEGRGHGEAAGPQHFPQEPAMTPYQDQLVGAGVWSCTGEDEGEQEMNVNRSGA